MEVTDKTIDKLSDLSRLNFDGEERDNIKRDLEKMLVFVEKLNSLDTDGVAPLVYMTEETLQLRKDEVGEALSQSEALKNGPSHDSDYFKVPKVLDK
ncbi:MAG: Asp-tRNA(Asn)/Glu-tRNA(Gln) amidotransferase subunit GatC [Flavobacteriales bacterium]|nr:Asp-tRNA(Asn)/Glu-tRNA(Gln) amidotransferase subunit GatC [Flavobacteriales bacterium]